MSSATGDGDVLSQRPVPGLLYDQIERFTLNSLQAKPVRAFDPLAALKKLHADDGKTVLAVDIGGDKIVWSPFEVKGRILVQSGEGFVQQGNGGSGYLEVLEEVAISAGRSMFPVGISFAGPTYGTKLLAAPNLPVFKEEVYAQYDGDFANIFPTVVLANDAEAGIMAAALESAKTFKGAWNVIYVINGSGLGGAVLKGNMIYATEPGHIEVIAQLNPFGQRRACGMLGADYVCIETVAASKAGIEDIWLQRRGERLTGKQIAAKYLGGDHMAMDLYDNSALVMAHTIKGMAKAFGLLEDFHRTVVVGHGGAFEVPGYRERLRSILTSDLSLAPNMLFTKDFSANTCLDGAAVAALAGGIHA